MIAYMYYCRNFARVSTTAGADSVRSAKRSGSCGRREVDAACTYLAIWRSQDAITLAEAARQGWMCGTQSSTNVFMKMLAMIRLLTYSWSQLDAFTRSSIPSTVQISRGFRTGISLVLAMREAGNQPFLQKLSSPSSILHSEDSD
jgi:hypothetical protein